MAMSNYQDGSISAFKSPNLVSDVLPLRFPLLQLLTILPSFQKFQITLKNSFHFAAILPKVHWNIVHKTWAQQKTP